jgi:AraC-like DNA-binding protein
MNAIDINPIFRDIINALQPIATRNDITLKYIAAEQNIAVSLPLDEVITPVMTLILKLLYIMPKERSLKVRIYYQVNQDNNTPFLRAEIITEAIFINPNLIFQAANNRFKIENTGDIQSQIYMDWPIDTPIYQHIVANEMKSIDVIYEENEQAMNSRNMTNGMLERFQDFGSNRFIVDKLNGVKTKKDADFLDNINGIITKNLDNTDFISEHLEKASHLSKAQLYRKLKDLTGYSSANYIRHIRLQKAVEYLETSELNISDITYKVGFKDLSYFSSCFLEEFHFSPTEWRKTHKMKQ